ncbi:S1C family serine protease [[Ruminococcus] lactaris]|uniref:S1C family serine protease n=1 Tax=[Ruminococcus] lactaris TaxID=46228 RepID=UPI0026DD9A9F|nr:trypsin-like peptidase domain-containing protein [[Ruminococcus] lactaris]
MDNQYSYYNPNETEGNTSNGTTFYNNGQGDDGKTPKKKKEHKKMPKAVAVTGLALMFGVVSSATFLTTNYVGTKVLKLGTTQKSTSTTSTSAVTSNASLTKTSSVVTSDVSSVVENVMPSIVSITNMSVQEVQNYFGGTSKQESESAGTGIIISQNDSELLVVTNNHVVAGSDTLTVTFADGNSVEANIKGTDSEYDVAVVAVPLDSISEDTKKAISVATLGDSTELKVGEPAIAIGNALGYGQSVTTGVISALNRSVSETDQTTGETTESSVKLIQTDAAINPGNSGGALVNASGEVIGINSSKLVGDSVEGVGYAIPISDVSDLIENLMNQETKTKVAEADQGAIGIKGKSVSTEYSQQLNMPEGVYVSEVTKGGGAEKAGMTRGCIITGINGTTVSSMDDLQEQLQYYAKGDEVELTIQVPQSNGEYQEQSVTVILGAKQTSK